MSNEKLIQIQSSKGLDNRPNKMVVTGGPCVTIVLFNNTFDRIAQIEIDNDQAKALLDELNEAIKKGF